MAIVLAPSYQEPLSILGLRWFLAPELARIFPAAAAATLQLLLVAAAAVGVWRLGEKLAAATLNARLAAGGRGAFVQAAARSLAALTGLALAFLALVALAIWSVTWRRPFPLTWPESWSLQIWRQETPGLVRPLRDTLLLAAVSTFASLSLAVAWLEADDRLGRKSEMAAIIPLLAPQLAFLFGVETLFAFLRVDGSFAAVALTQGLFVFSYVPLALADPWRALDPRYARAAGALGARAHPGLLWGRSPWGLAAVALLYGALDRRGSPLAPTLRSLVTVLVSQINHCAFCVDINSATLQKRGVGDDKIDAPGDWRSSALFSTDERLALEYAEAMTTNSVDDELRARLRMQWDEDAIVELTGLIAFQNLSSKFNAALDVPAQGFCRLPRPKAITTSGQKSSPEIGRSTLLREIQDRPNA